MPYARRNPRSKLRTRRTFKNRTLRRRPIRPGRVMRRKTLRFPRRIGLGAMQVRKLRYCEVISIDPAGGGIPANYTFRANDCYDPNLQSTGHQPNGFDQLIASYKTCHVVYSKMSVRYTPTNNTLQAPAWLSVRCEAQGPQSYVDTSDFLERNPGRKVIIGQGYANGSFENNMPVVSARFTPRVLRKASRAAYLSDPLNACTSTLSPDSAHSAYYNIWVADIDGTNPLAMTLTVTLDLYCVFTGYEAPDQS